MALIKCTECGKYVSDKASVCPHCGCPSSEFIIHNIDLTVPNDDADQGNTIPSDSQMEIDSTQKRRVIIILSLFIAGVIICVLIAQGLKNESTYTTKYVSSTAMSSIANSSSYHPSVYEKIETFAKENDIYLLDAVDVRYDPQNSKGKYFQLFGRASLSDYFNYSYSESEDVYFCAEVIPYDGSFSDMWYIYFTRSSFDDLYEELKQSDCNIGLIASLPTTTPSYTDEVQNDMATAYAVVW